MRDASCSSGVRAGRDVSFWARERASADLCASMRFTFACACMFVRVILSVSAVL